LCTARWVRAEFEQSLADAMILKRMAAQSAHDLAASVANRVVGVNYNTLGQFERAHEATLEAVRLVESIPGSGDARRPGEVHNQEVGALIHAAVAHWHIGRWRESARLESKAVRLAESSGHWNTMAYCMFFRQYLAALRRDTVAIEQHSRAVLEIALTYELPFWTVYGNGFRGLGRDFAASTEAARVFEDGIEGWRNGTARAFYTGVLGQLAWLHLVAGRIDQALEVIEDAYAEARRTGELWFLAELQRIHARVLLRRGVEGDSNRADALWRHAQDTACSQHAWSFFARASADLRARMLARGESALVSELDAHVRRVLPETVDPEVVESARTEPLEPF